MSVEEAATALGTGRTTGYQAIRRREQPHLHISRHLVAPRMATDRRLARDDILPGSLAAQRGDKV